jgi:predicted HTH transcriptional regulator
VGRIQGKLRRTGRDWPIHFRPFEFRCAPQERAGFVIWGIRNESHEIVGTKFKPKLAKRDQEELENYLARKLAPRINFKLHEAVINE